MGVRVPGLLLIILPFVLIGGIGAYVGTRGVSAFKKQGVAWGLTALMIVAAIGIGYAKAPIGSPIPDVPLSTPSGSETIPPDLQQGPGTFPSYVRDDAGVLSDGTVRALYERNLRLYGDYGVVIGVVTCNYGRSGLYDYTIQRAEDMGLTDYDFVVVLDIKGQDCGMIQGAALIRDFTDGDCVDYVNKYMERDFARGNYDAAVLSLTEMLEAWYGTYFG